MTTGVRHERVVDALVALGSLIVLLPLLPLLAALQLVDALRGGDRAGRLRDRVESRARDPDRLYE